MTVRRAHRHIPLYLGICARPYCGQHRQAAGARAAGAVKVTRAPNCNTGRAPARKWAVGLKAGLGGILRRRLDPGGLPSRPDERTAKERTFDPRERPQHFDGLFGSGELLGWLSFEPFPNFDNVRVRHGASPASAQNSQDHARGFAPRANMRSLNGYWWLNLIGQTHRRHRCQNNERRSTENWRKPTSAPPHPGC